MQTQHLQHGFLSFNSGGAVGKWRFCKISGGKAIQCTVAGEQTAGVNCADATTAADQQISLQPSNGSICLVEAGGTIAQDAYVMPDTQGRAVTFTGTGVKAAGIALDAGALGNFIRVLLIPLNGVTA